MQVIKLKSKMIALALVLSLLSIIFSLSIKSDVSATTKYIPGNNLSAVYNDASKLKLNCHTLTNLYYDNNLFWDEWSTNVLINNINEYGRFVKIKDIGAQDRSWDLITAEFSNVGYIQGRSLDCTLKVTRWISTGRVRGYIHEGQPVYQEHMHALIGIGESGIGIYANSGGGGGDCVDFILEVRYHDTGQAVGLPFYQGFTDVDINHTDTGATQVEGYYLNWGYPNTMYTWSGTPLGISGNRIWAQYPGMTLNGEDSWTRGGCICPTNSSSFGFSFTGDQCGAVLLLYSGYLDIPIPAKAVTDTYYYQGDTVTWTISEKLRTFYTDMFTTYSTLQFKDTIPAGLDYQSSRLLVNGTDVTYAYGGTPQYNSTTRELTYSLNTGILAQESFYDGKTLTFEITTKISADGSGRINNQGTVNLNGLVLTSNTVGVNVKHKITTEKEGSGSIDAAIYDIPSGQNRTVNYAPSAGWYLESVTIDGTTYSGHGVDSILTSYAFNNVQKDHHIKVVFKENPKITIRKQWQGTFPDAFGSKEFFFKITGTSREGTSYTWYRSITGNGETTIKVPIGTYKVSEIDVSRFGLTSLTAIQNGDNAGNCDTVNGDSIFRFINSVDDYKDYGHNQRVTNGLK